MAFGNLTEDSSITAESDTLGQSKYGVVESGVYSDLKISMAYSMVSKGGAMGIVLRFVSDLDGREINQTLWVTSGTAKGAKNYYETKKGEKRYLPGYEVFSAISKLSAGVSPDQLTTEEKTVSLYSYDEKKDVPTQVDVIMPLLNKTVTLGIFKVIEDKSINVNGPGETPNYQPTGETREINEIKKVFDNDSGMTVTEIAGGAVEADFLPIWREKFTGKTVDKSTGAAANSTGAGAASTGSIAFGAATSAADKPVAPIFGGA